MEHTADEREDVTEASPTNAGLEMAAQYMENAASLLMIQGGNLEKEYRKHAAAIRLLGGA